MCTVFLLCVKHCLVFSGARISWVQFEYVQLLYIHTCFFSKVPIQCVQTLKQLLAQQCKAKENCSTL